MTNFKLRFKPDVSLVEPEENELVIKTPMFSFPFKNINPGVKAVLQKLASSGVTDPEIKETLAAIDGGSGTFAFFSMFPRLMGTGMISHTLEIAGQPFVTVVPISPYYSFYKNPIEPTEKYGLSRFALMRQDKNELVVESPLAYGRLILHDSQAAALVALLNMPHTYPELIEKFPQLDEDSAYKAYQLLLSAKVVSKAEEEDTNPVLRQWDFHDLYFHTRSRIGRQPGSFGGNYRFIGEIPPLPAVKPSMSDEKIDLYQPDLNQLIETDVPFTQVLESRKSIRSHAETPITDKQLGEFLYRTARVRSQFDMEVEHGEKVEHTSRPYPNGGASYEFEIYTVINQCEGIAAGLYHYDPVNHQLEKIADRNAQIDNLLRDALATYDPTMTSSLPNVLLTLTSRFQRVSWKYDALAYAVMLKNVGVLQQTMYLVATAMNLAGCAIGAGNSDLFAAVAKTDYYTETSIGEFILGNPKIS